jgi:hypothetical protein
VPALPTDPALLALHGDAVLADALHRDAWRAYWAGTGSCPYERRKRARTPLDDLITLALRRAGVGAICWQDGPPVPPLSEAAHAALVAAFRGATGHPAPTPRPLPPTCGTYRYVVGQGVTVTPLEDE